MLVAIAAYRLRVGGRLVFLIPVPAGGDCPPLMANGGCMRVAAVNAYIYLCIPIYL